MMSINFITFYLFICVHVCVLRVYVHMCVLHVCACVFVCAHVIT